MAWPAWVSGAVQGGTGILGPIISGIVNSKANKKAFEQNQLQYILEEHREQQKWKQQNEYSEKVWNMQNKYNEDMWHKMNQYNAPQAQMERFKEAGLNPHLIYGQSNTTSPIATAQFGKNSQGSGRMGNMQPVKHDFGDIGGSAFAQGMLQARESAARVNNLESQNKVLTQDALLRSAQVIGTETGNKKANIELENIKNYSADAARLAVETAKQNIQVTGNRDFREQQMTNQNLRESAERIEKIKSEKLSTDQQRELQSYELELRRAGIMPNDPLFIKSILMWLASIGKNTFGVAPIGDQRY